MALWWVILVPAFSVVIVGGGGLLGHQGLWWTLGWIVSVVLICFRVWYLGYSYLTWRVETDGITVRWRGVLRHGAFPVADVVRIENGPWLGRARRIATVRSVGPDARGFVVIYNANADDLIAELRYTAPQAQFTFTER